MHLLGCIINCTRCTVHTSKFLSCIYVNVTLQQLCNMQMVECKCVSCTAEKFGTNSEVVRLGMRYDSGCACTYLILSLYVHDAASWSVYEWAVSYLATLQRVVIAIWWRHEDHPLSRRVSSQQIKSLQTMFAVLSEMTLISHVGPLSLSLHDHLRTVLILWTLQWIYIVYVRCSSYLTEHTMCFH